MTERRVVLFVSAAVIIAASAHWLISYLFPHVITPDPALQVALLPLGTILFFGHAFFRR